MTALELAEHQERHARHHRRMRFMRSLLWIGGVCLLIWAIWRAVPPSHIIIETGPVGGSYYQTAEKYKRVLERGGVQVELRPDPDSLEIIDHVEHMTNDVSIGFTAQQVEKDRYHHVASAGATELQPLFVFYNSEIGDMTLVSQLRGKRIVMPPERSATSQAALRVLGHYGITKANTPITFTPIAEAVRGMKEKKYDVGMFMLAPGNDFIVQLIQTNFLRLMNMRDSVALSRLEPYLSPTVLPPNIYDVEHNLPPEEVKLLAATVNVVVNKDLHPAILYLLFDAMSEVHQGPSLVNPAGQFPNLIDVAVPAHPLAKEYVKSGMPWIYRDLPLPLAGLIDYYLAIGLALFIISEFYAAFHYLTEMLQEIAENLALSVLQRIEHRTKELHTLGPWDMMMVTLAERALLRTSKHRKSEELIGRIRQATNDS